MFERLRKKGLALAVSALTVASMGIATPALAEDAATYEPDKAKLTKVIDAPIGTDASADKYVFQFAGGGTVEETADGIASGGVEQNAASLKVGDTVPTIPNVTLDGFAFTDANTLNNGQVAQGVVQKSIEDILTENNVVFPHAGVYTYVVTEAGVQLGATNASDGIYVNASQAEYILRIRVSNAKTDTSSVLTNRDLVVESVTIEQTKDDNGNAASDKIDPEYPTTTATGKIDKISETESPAENHLAGDERGREVNGFTFANEYIKGGSFVVKKLYDGDHSDRTKYSHVKLVVYSEAATNPDAVGCCLTYVIDGEGEDLTANTDSFGEHYKLNGVNTAIEQKDHYRVDFDANGFAIIEANLKEDSIIRVTGEFGPFNDDFANDPASQDGNKRMILSTSGLLVGQDYWVIESTPGDYEPTGYVYVGDDATVDPRVDAAGMEATQKLTAAGADPVNGSTINAGGLLLTDSATGSATTVFVVNTLDESKVSPTGILINNLPYILMVGGPLAIFAIMFVSKRRRNAAA